MGKSLRSVPQPLPPNVTMSLSPSRSLSMSLTATPSRKPSVLNPSKSSTKKSAYTNTNKFPKIPSLKPSKSPSRKSSMSKWSPSANPDNTDMEDTDTTTARKSPKKLPTMSPLSPLSISQSPLPSPPPRRSASTNPSTSPSFNAMSSRKNVPSKFHPSKIPKSSSKNVPLDSENPPAKRSNLPSPNKSVSNLSTDTPMNPHQHQDTLLLPPLPLNKSLATPTLPTTPIPEPNDLLFVNLCRSIAQKCFQDSTILSIFILLFMPSKIPSSPFLLGGA